MKNAPHLHVLLLLSVLLILLIPLLFPPDCKYRVKFRSFSQLAYRPSPRAKATARPAVVPKAAMLTPRAPAALLPSPVGLVLFPEPPEPPLPPDVLFEEVEPTTLDLTVELQVPRGFASLENLMSAQLYKAEPLVPDVTT